MQKPVNLGAEIGFARARRFVRIVSLDAVDR
jgi:hypothetical protein